MKPVTSVIAMERLRNVRRDVGLLAFTGGTSLFIAGALGTRLLGTSDIHGLGWVLFALVALPGALCLSVIGRRQRMALMSDSIILPWQGFRRCSVAFEDLNEVSLLKGRLGPRLVLDTKQGGRIFINLLDFEDESGASLFLETLAAKFARGPTRNDTRFPGGT